MAEHHEAEPQASGHEGLGAYSGHEVAYGGHEGGYEGHDGGYGGHQAYAAETESHGYDGGHYAALQGHGSYESAGHGGHY